MKDLIAGLVECVGVCEKMLNGNGKKDNVPNESKGMGLMNQPMTISFN
jgi:hypothetical protein